MEKLTEVLAQKLSMGGYAAYVWPSFAVAAIVLIAMVIASLRSLRKAQHTLSELQNLPRNET
jgi:heme exporter protein D